MQPHCHVMILRAWCWLAMSKCLRHLLAISCCMLPCGDLNLGAWCWLAIYMPCDDLSLMPIGNVMSERRTLAFSYCILPLDDLKTLIGSVCLKYILLFNPPYVCSHRYCLQYQWRQPHGGKAAHRHCMIWELESGWLSQLSGRHSLATSSRMWPHFTIVSQSVG